MKENHCDSIRWAGRLFKGAGVNSRVILKRTHEQVGHYGHHSQQPDEHHIAHRVLVTVQFIVLEAVTDVTVSVEGDASDVENAANDADAHEEATDLAVDVTQVPAIVEDRGEDQRVRVDGHHKVCHCQAHHKDVPCRENTPTWDTRVIDGRSKADWSSKGMKQREPTWLCAVPNDSLVNLVKDYINFVYSFVCLNYFVLQPFGQPFCFSIESTLLNLKYFCKDQMSSYKECSRTPL